MLYACTEQLLLLISQLAYNVYNMYCAQATTIHRRSVFKRTSRSARALHYSRYTRALIRYQLIVLIKFATESYAPPKSTTIYRSITHGARNTKYLNHNRIIRQPLQIRQVRRTIITINIHPHIIMQVQQVPIQNASQSMLTPIVFFSNIIIQNLIF